MYHRVVLPLLLVFTLSLGSVEPSRAQTPVDGGQHETAGLVGPSDSAAQASSIQNQPLNPFAGAQANSWWERYAPPTTPDASAANGPAVPADSTTKPVKTSGWSIGRLFKSKERKAPQSDPFESRPPVQESFSSTPTPSATDALESGNSGLAQHPATASNRDPRAPSTAGEAQPGSENLPLAGANGCPYPDTGIQGLYQPMSSLSGTNISDRLSLAESSQPNIGVRGAFNGLLGSDDARTKQEAEVPLLAPYKDLPAGYTQRTKFARPVKSGSISSPTSAGQSIADSEGAAPVQAVAESTIALSKYADTAPNNELVNVALTTESGGLKKQTEVAQAASVMPAEATDSNSHSSSEPLQLNGVEARQLTGIPLNRPKIIYHPGATTIDGFGHKVVKPEVHVAPDSVATDSPTSVQLAQFAPGSEGSLPPPANVAPETAYPIDEQQWAAPMSGLEIGGGGMCQGGDKCQGGPCQHLLHVDQEDCSPGGGIGAEYVAQAPFFIQTTQPFNNCRVRLDLARDLEFPDRSEFFWAKTPGGKGPPGLKGPALPGETTVDYQDLDFYMEKGTKRLGMAVNLPFRSVDPEIRDNATGFGDMSIQTKAVLMDGKCWQLTQLFNTYLPTGSASHGTGDGHVSLEPGVAYRWKWSDITYFHGDLKYLFPIAADPDFGGQIFNYGFGWSHVAVQTDSWALIPVFEVECWTFVDGRETIPLAVVDPATGVAAFRDIDTLGIMNICPGLRWVCDKGCDCGTKEFGVSAGINVTSDQTYEGLLRLEFRWSR